jgi:hypothetical protein
MIVLGKLAVGAGLTILPVGAFGQMIGGCQVKSILITHNPGESRDYASQFQGLTGQIPLGEYEITLRCGAEEIHKLIAVTHSEQFELISTSERLLISDQVKPKLSVKLAHLPLPRETWWVRMIGLYSGDMHVSGFDHQTGIADFTDPEPGSYLVSIGSTSGYTCCREIDLVESTRSWIFDRATCSFQLDQFAHLVEESNKGGKKRGGWYEEMRQRRAALVRSLRGAAEKQ